MKKILTTASLVALMAVPAFAQDTETMNAPAPAEQQDTMAKKTAAAQTYTGQISAKDLLNKNVRNSANEAVGDINDIRVDKDGKIAAVIVGVGGFLGLGEKNVALPYDQLSFARDEDGALIVTSDLTKKSLQGMPEWKSPDKAY